MSKGSIAITDCVADALIADSRALLCRSQLTSLYWFLGKKVLKCKASRFGEPTRGVVQEEHVVFVLERFEEEFEASLLKNKIVLDTTASTVDETLKEFVEKARPFLTESDRKRMRDHISG